MNEIFNRFSLGYSSNLKSQLQHFFLIGYYMLCVMNKDTMKKYLFELNTLLKEVSLYGEICIFGGSYITLMYKDDRQTILVQFLLEEKDNYYL